MLEPPGGIFAFMNRPPQSLEKRIGKIKEEMMALGDLRPGSLSKQYNVCGKPECRCKANPPRKHGPYYQLSFTWKGKSHSQFVRPEDVGVVKQQLRNYRRLRQLLERWIDLGMELSRRRLQQQPDSGPVSAKKRRQPRVSRKKEA